VPSPDQTVQELLAELEGQYAKLRDAINVIRGTLGMETLVVSETTVSSDQATATVIPGGGSRPGMIRSDQFFQMKVPEAIKAYLAIMKQPQKPKSIEKALRDGGLITTSSTFYANVLTALKRLREQGEVTQLPGGGGWGLAEWYKGRTLAGSAPAQKKGPKKGTKKAKRAGRAAGVGQQDTPKPTARAKAAPKAVEPTSNGTSTDLGRGAYLKFQREQIKAGKSMAEAAAEWRARKAKVTPSLPLEEL
jgi:hypothetical protein